MTAPFIIKRGDTGPALKAQILDANKQPVSLFMATVKFNMGLPDGTVVVDHGAATIVDAETGIVTYAWQASDTAEYGEYRAEFEVTFVDGTIETFPKSKSQSGNFIPVTIPEDVS